MSIIYDAADWRGEIQGWEGESMSIKIKRKTCSASDEVTIVYSVCGEKEPGLLLIHGGLADRTFWNKQFEAFCPSHCVVALDLPGHGESGSNRENWGLPEFGEDVKAVADAENLNSLILFGNSLGGPTAVEAALIMPGRVLGVVGIDTFQRVDYIISPEEMQKRAQAFRDDYSGMVKAMVHSLFHKDADPKIMAEAEKLMQKSPPEAAYRMFMGMSRYDNAAAVRRLSVPLRSINGDLYPTDVESVREIKPDFKAVIMDHMGHYPMLERPEEFNRHIAGVIAELTS